MKRYVWLVISGVLLFLSTFAPSSGDTAQAQTGAQDGAWSTKAPMPTARYGAAAGVINGKLYVAGGCAGFRSRDGHCPAVSTLEVYDPTSNTWATLAPMPTARIFPAAGVIEGKLYVVGGDAYNLFGNMNEVYDPVTNTWATLAPMPTAVLKATFFVIGDRLYIASGCTSGFGCPSLKMLVYDSPTNTWLDPVPIPLPMLFFSSGVISGQAFITAGLGLFGQGDDTVVYNPSLNTWTRGPAIPTYRWLAAAGVINGGLYVVGGCRSCFEGPDSMGAGLGTLEVLRSGTWKVLPSMPTARWAAAVGVINGVFYVVGGTGESGPMATLEAYEDDSQPPTSTLSLSGLQGSGSWFRSDVTVSISAVDNPGGSGILRTEFSLNGGATFQLYTAPFTISQEGSTTVLARSIDKAGNVESPPKSALVKIDKTPPSISGSRTPPPNANGWNSTDVIVTFSCADALSGVATCPGPTTLTTEGANQSVSGTSNDLAGNNASATVTGINIDKGPPSIIVSRSPERGPTGWNSSDVTVSFTCSDALSGVAFCPGATILTVEGANQSVTGSGTDRAGNSASTAISSINIDKTLPLVSITTPQPFAVLPAGTALSFSATDALSGVQNVIGHLNDGTNTVDVPSGFLLAVGIYTLTVEAKDLAGNVANESRFFVIYDPAAGFATGGGWFVPGGPNSDPGDKLPGLDSTSPAQFGFVVKYQPGATTPSGQLEFQYRQGNFDLRSSGMDWLVIVNNNWAKFQGKATIKGQTGEFPFRVDARDGDYGGGSQTDRFIIKVSAAGGNPDLDEPVYKASGDLKGGSIVIHTK